MSGTVSLTSDPETVVSRLRKKSTKSGRGGSVVGATDAGQQLGERIRHLQEHENWSVWTGIPKKTQFDRNFTF